MPNIGCFNLATVSLATEGFNNKIRRMVYGLQNDRNRRKRILAWYGVP